ncbi:MAG TPA: hypothetical protein VH020_05105 [Stellaceae bacterium]|nr:hypothetical protein [Stellaceae bacterium]
MSHEIRSEDERMNRLSQALANQFAIDFDEAGPKAPHGAITYRGVSLDSRWGVLREFEILRRFVDALPELVRRRISLVWCDSKAGSAFVIEIRPNRHAPELPDAIAAAMLRVNGGYNGIELQGDMQDFLEPRWLGDGDDCPDTLNVGQLNVDELE